MDVISVKVTYPSLLRSPLSTPPCTPPPIFRHQSFGSDQIPNQKGIVGFYDINELNDELRMFGISDETRTALLRKRKRKPATRKLSTTFSTKTLTCDIEYTNRNPSSQAGEQSRKLLLRHSVAARNCYVDFRGNFHDAVRAQSLKMAAKNAAPALYPNVNQRVVLQTPRRKQPKEKRSSALEPVGIGEGLLIVANGQVVDFRNDVKRSKKLNESERKRLRKEMREHLDIVRSFDDIVDQFDATKMQIEQMKSM